MGPSNPDVRDASHGNWNGELAEQTDRFANRHLGPDAAETAAMLKVVGYASLEELTKVAIPQSIARRRPLAVPAAATAGVAVAAAPEAASLTTRKSSRRSSRAGWICRR